MNTEPNEPIKDSPARALARRIYMMGMISTPSPDAVFISPYATDKRRAEKLAELEKWRADCFRTISQFEKEIEAYGRKE